MYSSYHYDNSQGCPVQPRPDGGGDWGAGIGFDLNFDGQSYGFYNASAYDGIVFWARSSSPENILVRVGTEHTTLISYGGTCREEYCNPASTAVGVTSEWAQYRVAFADLSPSPEDFGTVQNLPFEPNKVINIQFLYDFFSAGCFPLPQHDLWIDDLSFYVDSDR
jgi:hypothetical protein